ncbi:unnamed protein product [Danaus chrysippus]|uniref:(African queen) hypothetical protein n=1 Tax=Danaus chrysippus TaxID=151541 RepID=A0A8J2QHS9_9NEOP|nr:unnamed protein product [Danaus chrysippus]
MCVCYYIFFSAQVYASPSRRKMDTKGEGEEMTYPHICFMVDNFDEVFCDIVVRDGEMVCVELVARGRGGAAQAVIFLGSIRYDALTRVYDARNGINTSFMLFMEQQSSLSTKVAQRMSFGLLGRGAGAAARCEFVRMKGPGGKGHAEVAVSRARSSGVHTPCSEPGLGPELWDSDFEDDPDELFLYRHQRRLSDPSANLNHFVRGGWRARDKDDTSRSENEGLDALADGLAEVEAGDLRDGRSGRGRRASSVRWRTCCAGAGGGGGGGSRREGDMRDVYRRAPPDLSPGCLHTVSPRRRPVRPAPQPPPLRPLPARVSRSAPPDAECELACDASCLDGRSSPAPAPAASRRPPACMAPLTVRGEEELPSQAQGESEGRADREKSGGAWSAGARAYVTLPRRRGVAAVLFQNAPLPPRRTTPDGTDIYYWCDVPRRKLSELDDGAYNPLWAMRGFTQTFHLWKEGRRQQSAPLCAFLTYVTLPWWSIAKGEPHTITVHTDILDHREEPILTF